MTSFLVYFHFRLTCFFWLRMGWRWKPNPNFSILNVSVCLGKYICHTLTTWRYEQMGRKWEQNETHIHKHTHTHSSHKTISWTNLFSARKCCFAMPFCHLIWFCFVLLITHSIHEIFIYRQWSPVVGFAFLLAHSLAHSHSFASICGSVPFRLYRIIFSSNFCVETW